jgi:hypothetical protein
MPHPHLGIRDPLSKGRKGCGTGPVGLPAVDSLAQGSLIGTGYKGYIENAKTKCPGGPAYICTGFDPPFFVIAVVVLLESKTPQICGHTWSDFVCKLDI